MLLTAGRRPLVVVLLTTVLCLFGTVVFAQAVSDPNVAEFSPSTDHDAVDASGSPLVTQYSLSFFTVGGTTALLTVDLGKPSPDPDGMIRVNFRSLLSSLPASGVTYEARVSSVGPGGVSDSLVSNQFLFSSTPCSPTLGAPTASAAVGGGTGSIAVTAGAGCTWTAVSKATWITVTSGASGSGNGSVGYSVAANTGASGRTGTITIAGQVFAITQAGTSCTYTVSAATVSVSAAAGLSSVTVTTTTGCTWSATSNVAWAVITNGNGRSGNGALNFSVTANSGGSRTGTLTVAGKTVTVTQSAPPTFTVSPSSLNVGVNKAGTTVRATTAQQITVTQSAGAPLIWLVASNAAWLTVSPANGSGSATVNLTYNALAAMPANGSVATVTVTAAGSATGPQTVQVKLTVVTAPAAPVGVMDTPVDGTTGVTGSIAVTGWALDDIDVAKVRVLRDPVPGEAGSLMYLGDAVLVNGSRPDVAAMFPNTPHNTRAGWGLLVLTNMLPNQGNGTFRLHAFADDVDGHSTLLGSKTFTCTNATATLPFGAIDTPGQGQTVSGTNYANFGWVLARGTKHADPPGGGNVRVVIDGAFVGSPVGWTSRSDLTALFPLAQYSGVNSALGVYNFNTTTLVNGVHTIAWVVADNTGAAAGIGSRYFSVLNSGGLTLGLNGPEAAVEAGAEQSIVIAGPEAGGANVADVSALAAQSSADMTPVSVRRGYSFDTPFRRLRMGDDGRFTVQSEELDRVEVRLASAALDEGACSGYSVTAGIDAPLPVGSSLDPASCVFTWQPGVGFVGTYEFVFVRQTAAGPVRRNVQVVLNAKRSGLVGPQVVIDTPSARESVGGSFVVAGWAIDLDAEGDTGIDTLHMWAYPTSGGAPIFLGAAAYGGSRPDVAAVFGKAFAPSGYGFEVKDLAPGTYDLAVFPWSKVMGHFAPASVVRVTVK
jgi:Viral BACON domain/Putative binding domain, N-terminal